MSAAHPAADALARLIAIPDADRRAQAYVAVLSIIAMDVDRGAPVFFADNVDFALRLLGEDQS